MSTNKEGSKDIINFLHLCKDLYKYIQRKVIKKYVQPEMTYANINSYNSVKNKKNRIEEAEEKKWKYYNIKEKLSEEEKILNIFKDNGFLAKIQKCYESLEIVIEALDENLKNIQLLKKNIEVGENNMQLLSQLNTQLNHFFKSKNEKNEKLLNNINDSNINKNVMDRLDIVKSLNFLNDLKLMHSINGVKKKDNNILKNSSTTNTSNTTITNNNNIILDNKIINNNIRAQDNKDKIDLISEEPEHEPLNIENKYEKKNDIKSIPIPSYLNKKIKRDKKVNEENNNYYKNNNNENNSGKKSLIQNNINTKIIKKKKTKNKNFPNPNDEIIKGDLIINDSQNINNINNVDKILEIKENDTKSEQDNESEKTENTQNKIEENNESKENINNINNNTLEIEFDKVLRKEFSSIYFPEQNYNTKKEIIREIKIILKKIPNMKFNKENKFDDPYIIGSFSHYNLIYLLDYLPPIDILFKCKCIEGLDELKDITIETMQKKLCLKYIEIAKNYDKKNEIVKISNKCKIKIKNKGDIFIYINLFFVGVNLSNYSKKEQSLNRFFFSNNISDDKGKLLISLFFRKWRRKFKLFFIMPEFLDVITCFYFNEKETLALIIEKIFFDLFNGQIKFDIKNNNVNKDGDNIKEIKSFIDEWFNNNDDKSALTNAIINTQELIMKNDFYSTFNNEEE